MYQRYIIVGFLYGKIVFSYTYDNQYDFNAAFQTFKIDDITLTRIIAYYCSDSRDVVHLNERGQNDDL